MGMLEVNEAADQIEKSADKDAIVIFGASVKKNCRTKSSLPLSLPDSETEGQIGLSGTDIIRPGADRIR